MVERYSTGKPLPPAHPAAHGRAPLADGQTVRQPQRQLPLATREVVWILIGAGIMVAGMAYGIMRSTGILP